MAISKSAGDLRKIRKEYAEMEKLNEKMSWKARKSNAAEKSSPKRMINKVVDTGRGLLSNNDSIFTIGSKAMSRNVSVGILKSSLGVKRCKLKPDFLIWSKNEYSPTRMS